MVHNCTTNVFRAIGRHISVALLLSFHPVELRCDTPVEDLVGIQGLEDAQRSLALQPSGTRVPTYTPHTTLVEQSSSLISTTYRSRTGLILFAPPQVSELLRVASSCKRRRDNQTLRSAVPSAVILFVVVVGPSDLGLCLTGALHYIDSKISRVHVLPWSSMPLRQNTTSAEWLSKR